MSRPRHIFCFLVDEDRVGITLLSLSLSLSASLYFERASELGYLIGREEPIYGFKPRASETSTFRLANGL